MSEWIQHDGARPNIHQSRWQIQFDQRDAHLIMAEGYTSNEHPCWFWRWKHVRVGWFKMDLRRVCDDPAYAPILRYREVKPRAVEVLAQIAADPSQPIAPDAPQHEPKRERVGQ